MLCRSEFAESVCLGCRTGPLTHRHQPISWDGLATSSLPATTPVDSFLSPWRKSRDAANIKAGVDRCKCLKGVDQIEAAMESRHWPSK